MSDLLVFYPKGSILYLEFLGRAYIERQPKTSDESLKFMNEIKPVIEQLDAYVLKHGFKEIMEVNLKGVPISKLNSETALNLMNMVSAIRPDKNILQKIVITNTNPVFNMLYKGVRSRLPPKVRDIVQISSDSKFF